MSGHCVAIPLWIRRADNDYHRLKALHQNSRILGEVPSLGKALCLTSKVLVKMTSVLRVLCLLPLISEEVTLLRKPLQLVSKVAADRCA